MSEIKTRNEWEKIVHSFKKSGLSATQWCKDHNLSYHAFMYWHYKMYGRVTNRAKPNKKSKESNTEWLAVKSSSTNIDSSAVTTVKPIQPITTQAIKVSVGKADITVNSGFDKVLFQDVVKVLTDLC